MYKALETVYLVRQVWRCTSALAPFPEALITASVLLRLEIKIPLNARPRFVHYIFMLESTFSPSESICRMHVLLKYGYDTEEPS